MAYVRAGVKAVFDNPHADGLLTQLGVGLDWEAGDAGNRLGGRTADLSGTYGWELGTAFEYIKGIGALAPIGRTTPADMALTDWEVLKGTWKLSASSANLQHQWLHYYDGRPNRYAADAWGQVRTKTDRWPNLQFDVWRMGSAPGETDRAMFAVHFRGAGADYALCFPGTGADDSYWTGMTGGSAGQLMHPALLGRADEDATWTIIDQITGGSLPNFRLLGGAAALQSIRVEAGERVLTVGLSGEGDPWHFAGEWRSAVGGATHEFTVVAGKIEVRVLGHTAMFSMLPITYAASGTLKPSWWFLRSDTTPATPSYSYSVADVPTDTTLSVAEETAGYASRPVVTFGTSDTTKRALLYCVHEYRAATFAAGTSDPYDTTGDTSRRIVAASGSIGEGWRGSQCRLTMVSKPGVTNATVDANSKIAVSVTGDLGATWTTQFAGRVTPPALARPERVLASRYELAAEDLIGASLARKHLGWSCSFEGWPIAEAFAAALNLGGIPAALVTTTGVTGSYPVGSSMARKLNFRPDTALPQVLDTLAQAAGLEWGQKTDGKIFLRNPVTHTSGAYDYTLDDDTTSTDDVVDAVRGSLTYGEFCNLLTVVSGEGAAAKAKVLRDLDSIMTPGALRFIGDLWQRFRFVPDGTDLDTIASNLWEDLGRWCYLVEWTMQDHPEIMPDHFVRLQVSGIGAVTNSIVRVLSKPNWSVDATTGRYSQTLVARLEEVPGA